MQPKFRLNFVNSQNSITFAYEESFECNALQNAELRTVAMSLPTFWTIHKTLSFLMFCRYLSDFSRKQEAWPCFPVQSRNYLCAQNGNDCLMRTTERRENGGKRKQRHIERKQPREIRIGKKPPKKERKPCRKRETGQTSEKKYAVSVGSNSFGSSDTAFFRFARRPWRLVPFMAQAVTDGFPLRHKWTAKKRESTEIP